MIYLAYLSVLIIVFQCINAILNLLFQQKLVTNNPDNTIFLSILIPARNESKNIHHLLSNLHEMKDLNVEIIVYNDQSTDDTELIIKKFIEKDKRIKLITGTDLPKEWLGKNYACHQLAQVAQGNYFLFLDADVRIPVTILPQIINYFKQNKLTLLSVFPIQITTTWGEKITVPLMNYILLTLLPLIFVKVSPFKSHAAANGQFMLFDSNIYRAVQPHQKFCNSPVEDISIARYFKKEKLRIACLTGINEIKCHMYHNYAEATYGFAKNIFMFFGNQPIVAIMFFMFNSLGFIPIMLAIPHFLFYYFVIFFTIQFIYSKISKFNFIQNLLLYPLQMITLLYIIILGLKIKFIKKYQWKSREFTC